MITQVTCYVLRDSLCHMPLDQTKFSSPMSLRSGVYFMATEAEYTTCADGWGRRASVHGKWWSKNSKWIWGRVCNKLIDLDTRYRGTEFIILNLNFFFSVLKEILCKIPSFVKFWIFRIQTNHCMLMYFNYPLEIQYFHKLHHPNSP